MLNWLLDYKLRGALALFFVCPAIWAQGINGAVTGIVQDSSQAVIGGAGVTLTLVAAGTSLKTATNEAGVFRFASVPIGRHELRVEFGGFKTYIQRDIIVETGQTVRADVRLELGGTQESVTVTAEAPLLERETSGLGTQMSNDLMNTLPYQLTGGIRNPLAAVNLTAGAEGTSGAADGIRIAGSRTYSNEVMLDGVPFSYNAQQNVAGPAAPALETVSEFRVETAIAPAEYGRTAGGVVMMASRSGANQLHGNLFALFRNNVLDARRYNAARADITRQGEFGASLGGPVFIPRVYDGHNRTFFFANYTGFRRLSEVQGQSATLPTALMRQGDFSESPQRIYDPLSSAAGGPRQQFPGNRIPESRISPFALKFQQMLPLPNAPGLANNYRSSMPSTLELNSGFLKIDHALTDRNRLSASYRSRQESRVNGNGFVLPISDLIHQGIDAQNGVVSQDLILRPNLLNRVQIGVTRYKSALAESGDAGLKVPGAFESGFPGIIFSGQGLTRFGYGNDRSVANNNINLQESLAWTRGTHGFKFGARFDNYQYNLKQPGFREGQYTFTQVTTSQPQVARTGHSYASFLLGQAANANMTLNSPTGDRSRYFAVYAQDDWKLTRRVTLNYGYRWEVQTPFREAYDRLSTMDPNVPNPGAAGYPGAVVFAGDGPGRSGMHDFMQTYYGAHSGRLGVAVQASRHTVIRAGAGLFYSPLIGLDNDKTGFNARITRNSQDGGLTRGFAIDQGWPADSVVYPPFLDRTISNGSNTTTTENRPGGSGRLPRTSQWQFSIQRLFGGVLLETSYVGTVAHGITNSSLVAINQVDPRYLALGSLLTRRITDPAVVAAGFKPPYAGFNGTLAQSLRAFPQYQNINTLDAPTGNSTYHAMFLKAEKRFSHGLQFLASYTISKSISDISFMNTELGAPQDQYNRRAERSVSNVDIPQKLVASFSYDLPFGHGRPFASGGWTGAAFGGWTISGVLSYYAGTPVRVSMINNLPLFNGRLRPNQVPGVAIREDVGRANFRPLNALSGETGDGFLNPAAFTSPAPFTFGSLGVFLPNIRTFGVRNEDFSIVRRFRFRERRRLDLRADFFNAFNRRNLDEPVLDVTDPNFGRITGQGPARSVQLGLRAEF